MILGYCEIGQYPNIILISSQYPNIISISQYRYNISISFQYPNIIIISQYRFNIVSNFFKPIIPFYQTDTGFETFVPKFTSIVPRFNVFQLVFPIANCRQTRPIRYGNPNIFSRTFDAKKTFHCFR